MNRFFSGNNIAWGRMPSRLLLPLVIIMFSGLSSESVSAELMVLYPEVKGPFSKVFEDISLGAKEKFSGNTSLLALDEKTSAKPVLDAKNPDVVLVLGKRSLDVLRGTGSQIPLVLGAVNDSQYTYPGILMIPDPEVVIDRLLMLAPSVKRVHVVQKAHGKDVQLKGASEYLARRGVQLMIDQATDLRDAASLYAKMIEKANSTDAVWILQDGSYVNSTIFSVLLDAAWSKNLVVFSSNPLHVKHGALFAVYPDNKKMGGSLGEIANQVLRKEAGPEMKLLRDVLVAVNERTGNHLGISLSNDVRGKVDLILPAR
ncbi:ABC transporter substrate binding protein [Porticoccus sp.]